MALGSDIIAIEEDISENTFPLTPESVAFLEIARNRIDRILGAE